MSRADSSDVSRLITELPSPETIADPYPLYARLREHTPAFGYQDYPPGTVPGQDEPVTAWVLMKYDEVLAAAQNHDTFSSRDPLQEQSSAPSLMLVNHDNPEHDRLREFVSHPFAFRQIDAPDRIFGPKFFNINNTFIIPPYVSLNLCIHFIKL